MTDRDPADDERSDRVDDERSEYVDEDEDPGWPWSFILLVVAGALYLIFRFAELAINLFT